MFLTSVSLTNYRCFKALTVALEPRMNVIVGVNGSGKTSLLMGICQALHGISLDSHPLMAFSEDHTARIKVTQMGVRRHFEPQYPVEIAVAAADGKGENFSWMQSLNSDGAEKEGISPNEVINDFHHIQNYDVLPLAVFYRANRQWNTPEPDSTDAATLINHRIDAYEKWQDASLTVKNLQDWVIKQCLVRFEVSSQTGTRFDDITNDELAIVNATLSQVLTEAKGLRFDLQQTSMVVDWHHLAPSLFSTLSEGQRAIVGLVADIARRMCLLNPQLGMDVTQQTPGVVLIDEIDLHLHPKWQQTILGNLSKAFPKVQFMVTTHSPQVLSTVRRENIRVLSQNEDGYEATMPEFSPLAHASGDALAYIMDTHTQPQIPLQQDVHAFEQLVRNGEENSEAANTIRQKLDKAGYQIQPTDLSTWRFLAQRKAQKVK